jgi:hypothetical protein
MSVTDGLLTPAGFDPTSPMIPPTVPMSSGGVTVQGPRVARKLPGQVEIGSNQRIDDALKAQQDAAQAEADAKAAQNQVLAERARREAEIERQSNERLVADAAARDAETKRRQDIYDSEVRGFEKKHGGDQSYSGNHSVTDKLVSAVAVALGGIGMAIARRPGENPVLGVVNSQISEWYDNQNKTLERDREKLARSKTSIEDQSKYFDKRRLQVEAEKQALLTRTAKEFEAQGSLAKNPEIQAQAKQNAAKFALEAEKQREFVMAGQRVDESLPTVSATRTNSGPSADWAGMPGAPKLPTPTGPGAQSPITGATPVVGPSNAVGATAASAPPVRMDPNAAAGATNPGDALKKILDAGNKVVGSAPNTAVNAAKPAANPTQIKQPTPPVLQKTALPAPNKDGVIADAADGTTDLSKIDKRVLAASGPIYGDQGKIIALISDKKLAESTNLRASSMKHYSDNIIKAKSAADEYKKAMDAAGIGEIQALALSKLQDSEGMLVAKKFGGQRLVEAKQRFLQAMKNVRGSAKGAVASDAMSDSEAAVAMPISDVDVYFGTYGTTANEALSSGAERVKSIYASVGLNPDAAFNGLVGKANKPAPQAQVAKPAQVAPDAAMMGRAREAAKDPGPRGQRAREWLQQNGAK